MGEDSDVMLRGHTWGSRRYQGFIYGKTDSRKDVLDLPIQLHKKKQCLSCIREHKQSDVQRHCLSTNAARIEFWHLSKSLIEN